MHKVQKICGGLNPYSSQADAYAEKEYRRIRSMSRDCIYISRNTGIPYEIVSLIKGYLFDNQHFLSNTGMYGRFDADYSIAQSWARLSNRKSGKGIQPHDVLLLNHEWLEIQLMLTKQLSQQEAHYEASKMFNYTLASADYYKRLGFDLR